jgi:fused signal recognition particle receptor
MGLFDWLKKKDENINTEVNTEENTTENFEEAVSEENVTETYDETFNETSNEIANEDSNEAFDESPNEEAITTENETFTEENNEETTEESIDDHTEANMTEEAPKKLGFFAKIKQGLAKTRDNIMSGVEDVLKSFSQIDEDLYEELEEALIMADIGVETSVEIINRLRAKVKSDKIKDAQLLKPALIEVINTMLTDGDDNFEITSPAVILVIGVNGVGKTTTIGKLANNLKSQGKTVMLAAADTFRAAAIDQLEIWGERNNVPVIKHQENSDPGAVVYDAVKAAKARGTDVLICDTAGRLHNKKNLMDELKKISKIVTREYGEAQIETFLVLDATTGQNAVQQAKLFNEAADITGIVLTKLDGTAKGGIVLAIKNEMNIPVRYIGVGEGIDDLQQFNSIEFSRAIFGEE